jgi:hypothetical protein
MASIAVARAPFDRENYDPSPGRDSQGQDDEGEKLFVGHCGINAEKA